MGDNLTYAAHRTLLPGQSLVKEYSLHDLTSFPATGTTDPAASVKSELGDEYRRLQNGGFADWRLSVEGRVAAPRTFSLADLKQLHARTQITRHTCEEGWTAIGQWTGVTLGSVLDAAGMLPDARFVVFSSYDDWVDCIDLFDALHPQTILAYGMNGRDLPIQHGAPVRLRVERQMGYKSMKYVRRIVVADRVRRRWHEGEYSERLGVVHGHLSMRFTWRAITVLLLWSVAPVAPSLQTPRFELSHDSVLTDEPFRMALSGLEPGQQITIRADGNRGIWHSSGTFQADGRGRVEVADPMKFVWSASGERPPAAATAPAVQPWVFTAETDGHVIATATISRRVMAAGVRAVPVRERGLVGVAYYPADAGRRPAVIVVSGSEGGIPRPGAHAGGLASRGYVVLALAYFNAEGLTPLLNNIPLEYFATAADWLKSQPAVDPARIGVLGTSRGGELALLLGATYPSAFRVVVANVPSSVVWPGLSDDAETPAWTVNGKPLVSVPGRFTRSDLALSGRDRFLKRMNDGATLARAAIPVERIGGPVLLFSGVDDQLWPSDIFAEQVVRRLKAHHFKHAVEHYSYENAGHRITRPYVPTSDVRVVRPHPVSKRPNMSGGTPEGQARANVDSWQRLLSFLDKHLGHN